MMFMCEHHTPPSAANVTTCVLRVSLTTLPAADILYRYCPALLDSVTQCVLRVSLMTLPAADSCTGTVWLCWTQCDNMCVKTLPAADIAIQVLSGFVVGHSVTAQPAQHSHHKRSGGCQQCGLLHRYLPVNGPLFWVKLFVSSSSLLLL